MNRVTISLTPSVKDKAAAKVAALKRQDQRFSFSRYVEELLRKDLAKDRSRKGTAKGRQP